MTEDYFTVFELPCIFNIDLTILEKNYFAEQRRFHPDRLIGKTPAEREQAIRQSMLINEGYEVLKSPLKRAQYMLKLAGVTENSVKPMPQLLVEIMDLREALLEADSLKITDAMAQQNETEIAGIFAELTQAFFIPDFDEAAQLTMRLSYLMKLEDEIRVRRKRITG